MNEKEKLSVDETVETAGKVITFYSKYKKQIWAAIALIVGLLGGNADRVGTLVPNVTPATQQEINAISEKVKVIEKDLGDVTQAVTDLANIVKELKKD